MDNQTLLRLKEILAKHQDCGVVMKGNPSIDEAAAALSMYLALRQMGKNVTIVCPTAPTVEISSLVGVDKITNSFLAQAASNQQVAPVTTQGTGDLTVSFPYREGEIEKVSYTLESGKLNIIVKAGPKGLSFQNTDVSFVRSNNGSAPVVQSLPASGGKAPTVLFIIGVPRLSDLSNVINPDALRGITIVNMDNKPDNQGFGDIVVVSPKFSSVSEQVADFLTLLEPNYDLDVDTAQNLLSGIVFATDDFKNPRTSYLALEMVGILMRKGAVRKSQGGSFAQQPMPQMQQPMQQPNPFMTSPQQQPMQPMGQQPVSQPMQQQVNTQPQQPMQQDETKQAPPDWLTPKVYKGSSLL